MMAASETLMLLDPDSLRHDLTALQQQGAGLATSCEAAAARLEARGSPPSLALAEELATFTAERDRLLVRSAELAPNNPPDNLPALARLIAVLEQRVKTITRLDELCALPAPGGPATAGWEQVRAEATELRTRLQTPSALEDPACEALVTDFVSGTDPLGAIWELTGDSPSISDARWTECNQRITQTYGPDLATAIARGKLRRGSPVLNPPAPVAPAPLLPKPPASISHAAPPPEPVAPISPRLDDETQCSRQAWDWDEEPLVDPAVIPAAVEATASTTQLARAALDATGLARSKALVALIWDLLAAGRTGPAYHLARCLEGRAEASLPGPPSWLIRAVGLAPHIWFSTGDCARLLRDDFVRFRAELLQSDHRGWNEGIGFLLRAAAFQPALIAPATGAATVLATLKRNEGYSHFYNFTARIRAYGSRLKGLDPGMFKAQRDDADWLREITAFRQEVEAWIAQIRRQVAQYVPAKQSFLRAHWTVTTSTAVRFPAAVRDWRKRQETLRTVLELLAPVRNDAWDQRHQLRTEVERWTAHGLSDSVRTARDSKREQDAAQSDEAAMLQAAYAFAGRWVRLAGHRADRGFVYLPPEAEQLRDEVRQRAEQVQGDLRAFEQEHPGPEVRAGVACCVRAIEQVRRLFEPEPPMPAREQDPRQILQAELLKIPRLPMNDSWEPTCDLLTLENELLQLLSEERQDWTTAFHLQCAEQNHTATTRLLELDVWSSPAEREELVRIREQEVAHCRAELQREIAAAVQRIEEAHGLGLLGEHDRIGFETQVQRLRAMAPQTLDFVAARRQLQHIADGVLRRKSQELDRLQRRWAQLQGTPPAAGAPTSRESSPPVRREPLIPTAPAVPAEPPTPAAPDRSVWVVDF